MQMQNYLPGFMQLRAYNKVDKLYYYLTFNEKVKQIIWDCKTSTMAYPFDSIINAHVIWETPERPIGLIDKNEKLIYEGDLLKLNNNPKDLAEVKFGEFGVVDIENKSKIDTVFGSYLKPLGLLDIQKYEPFCWELQLNEIWLKRSDAEIIGNINENPELLEV